MFEINEGDVTGVQRISFVGNEHFSDGTLRGKIRTSESAWYRFLSSDDRYDPDRLNLDRELLRKFYLSEGYADFRVVSAVAELAPNREGFFITFTISEGERYKFGKVEVSTRFQGLDVDVLKSYLTMAEGDWYDAERGREDRHRPVGPRGLAGLRLRRGPPQHPAQQGQPHGRRDLRHPGGAARLCRAHQHLGQHAYSRQGDPPRVPPRRGRRLQRPPRCAAASSACSNLGFFEKVDISAAPGSAPDKTNLEVQVVEQSTGDISFGAGYSTTSGILGDISIKERNLLGKGQELRLGLSLGTLSTLIDLSFTEPYFMDRPMAAGFDIFRTSNDRQSVASYSDRSLGFALRAGWAYTEHTRQTVRYTLRQTEIYNVQPWASHDRSAERRHVGGVGSRRDDRLGYPRHAPQYDKGLLLRNTHGGGRPDRHGAVLAHHGRRRVLPEPSSRMSSPRSAARSAR